MNRTILVGAAVLLVSCATAASCKGRKRMEAPSVAVEEYPPFVGANRVEASPSGAFFAAELRFIGAGELPLLEVIEHASGKVVATARGSLLGAPDDTGEAFYLAPGAKSEPTVRSTKRANFAASLPGAVDPFFTGYRAGGRLVVVHPVGDGAVDLSSIDLSRGVVAKTRHLGGDPRSFRLVASAALDSKPILYLSFQTPISAEAEKAGTPAGYLAALDAATLDEKWRSPWKPAALLFLGKPALAVSGDGRYLVARATNQLQIVSADDGHPVAVTPFSGLSSAQLRSFPGKSAVLTLESTTGAMADYQRQLEWIELPSGAAHLLWTLPRKDFPSPTDFVVAGGKILLAVQPKQPRYANDKSTWGPEILRYLK